MNCAEYLPKPSRSGTALLVDDDDWQLEVLAELVSELGLRPMIFSTADDALRFLKNGREDIRLLIADFYTPGELSGGDLARLAQAQLPELPVIVISGSAESGAQLDPDVHFMLKPWSFEALSELVLTLTEEVIA